MSDKTLIIAEAGVNHNGKIDIAKLLINEAFACGADAIKFQIFKGENIISKYAKKAKYQLKTTNPDENQLEMIKKLELKEEEFLELKNYCDGVGIIFMASVFDIWSIEFLLKIGIKIFKIPSGEITNYPYLKYLGSLNKQIIMSTGMANLGEIEDALDILTSSGTKKENITLMHCITEYPSPYEEVNLNAMITLKEAFKMNVGYSDHTLGIEIPIAAVALGAKIIEKHFTLNKNMEGPDHKASLDTSEMKKMIMAIRNLEKALGNGIKKPSISEIKNREVVRKSIVAKKPIKKGELFTKDNITVKRPGTGISPMEWEKILGRKAEKDYEEDDLI